MRRLRENCDILRSVIVSGSNLLQRHPSIDARQNSSMNDSGAIGADEVMIGEVLGCQQANNVGGGA
jgi:hypothetical protein